MRTGLAVNPYPCYCPASGPACDVPFEYCDRVDPDQPQLRSPAPVTDSTAPDAPASVAFLAPDEDTWPFRHVALFCDYGPCDEEVDADIRADSFAAALPGLRSYARGEGWETADDQGRGKDLCPQHRADPDAGALLGVPAAGDEAPGA